MPSQPSSFEFARPSRFWLLAAAAGLLAFPEPAPAVILYSTSDPTANTTAPTGGLAGSGWELQGTWGNFLGTPISPHHFITASHVNPSPDGAVGGTFTIGSVNYTTTGYYTSPSSDLRIWEVSGTFNAWADLYLGSDEVDRNLVVFGRGTQRGTEVTVNSELKGWQNGASDHIQRWGENFVYEIVSAGGSLGDVLQAGFFRELGGNVATLSVGDSGGGVFIHDGISWKLAGINYGIDGPFSLTGEAGTYFNAAIFDAGGLYYQGGLIPNGDQDIAAAFYATRISSNSAWILSTVPEPRSYGIAAVLGLAAFVALRKRALWRKGGSGPSAACLP